MFILFSTVRFLFCSCTFPVLNKVIVGEKNGQNVMRGNGTAAKTAFPSFKIRASDSLKEC